MQLKELNTPCYILNEQEFIRNINNFQRILDHYFNKNILGYSFKTNSLPYIIATAKECGCYAETVSDTEYQLACKIGYDMEKIIFNGPVKGKQIFFEAFEKGSIINIDSYREIEWLKELSDKGLKRDIGIRVNVDLEAILPGQTAMGEDGGRFGFCLENGCLSTAIQSMNKLHGISVAGFHMHVSSKSRSVEVFRELAGKACEIAATEGVKLKYLDIGGGFFGGGDEGESYKKYIEAIYNKLKEYQMENIMLIVEPGASVIATAVDYMAEVIDVKTTNRNYFAVTNGSRLHIDPFYHKTRYSYTLQSCAQERCNSQVICGYTCMEKDRIMEFQDELQLAIGDRIVYHVAGAYTMCFDTLFIDYLPYVYCKKNGKYEVIREKWGVEEYLQKNRWKMVE